MLHFFVSNNPPDKIAPQIVIDLLRLVGYVISKAVWFIRYRGRKNIPGKEVRSFLICANHQTYVDPVWVCLPMRRRLRFMAFDKAFEWRFIGPLIRYLGAFPVSLDTGGAIRTMKEALRELDKGAVLTIFPEGAREFADGRFFKFKTGAVRIAMQAGVPILPVTINGGNQIWPQKQKYPYLFRRVEIIYHPVMHVVEDETLEKDANLDIWTEKLRETIESAYRP